MVEPSKLFAGVSAGVWPERAKALYGGLIPVPADRVIEATDGLELSPPGGRSGVRHAGPRRAITCAISTPKPQLFTGDTFGPVLPPVRRGWPAEHLPRPPRRCSSSPTRCTTPSAAWRPSSRWRCIFTHYAQVTDVPRLAADLHRLIDAHVAIAERHAGGRRRKALIEDDIWALVAEEAVSAAAGRRGSRNPAHPGPGRGTQRPGLDVWLGSR